MSIHTDIASITTTSLVTEERGSWQWQDAYRVAGYSGRIADDGRALWSVESHSGKISLPQSRNYDYEYSGGLHNRPIVRREAVAQLGELKVRSLEGRGVRFHVAEQQVAA